MKLKKPKGEKELFPHTQKRAKERYDLTITREDYLSLCSRIKRGLDNSTVTKLKRQSNTRIIVLVPWGGKELVTVYDSRRKLVSTVLPYEAKQQILDERYSDAERT